MFIGGPCHGAIEHIEGYFILRFQGLEDRWQFSTENLATLWQKGNTKPIRPEPEPIIMLTLKYSRNMVHVCVCVPFNDFCVVFFWRFAMRKRPWFNIRTFFRCAPEIPSHGRFGGVAVTRDHQSHQGPLKCDSKLLNALGYAFCQMEDLKSSLL